MTTTVLLAGATGMLGNRVAAHLLDQPDVALRLLLRQTARVDADKAQAIDALVARGAVVAVGDVTDPASLDAATAGVDVVVSALQGGPNVIVEGQVALAEARPRPATGSGASCRRTTPSTGGDHALGGQRHDPAHVRLWFERLHRVGPNIVITVNDVWVTGGLRRAVVFVRWTVSATLLDGKPPTATAGSTSSTCETARSSASTSTRTPRRSHTPWNAKRSPVCRRRRRRPSSAD